MPFVTVASAKDMPQSGGTLVEAAGRKVALFRVDGQYYALDNACPHKGASLAQGTCWAGEVRCPLHDARFEISTGRHLSPPAKSDVACYAVRVEGDAVQIDFDAPRPTAAAPSAPTTVAEDSRGKRRKRVEVADADAWKTPGAFITIGTLLGLALASGGWAAWRYVERRDHAAEVAKLKDDIEVMKAEALLPAGQIVKEGKLNPEDQKRVHALGEEMVEHLRNQRALAVYKLATPELQGNMSQAKFEEMVGKITGLKWVSESPAQRNTTVRRAAGGKGLEYYCSAPMKASVGVVQFAFTFVPQNNEWRIDSIDLAQDK